MIRDADYWIRNLNLIKHDEGGYFREIYRSSETIEAHHLPERFGGPRALATSIYFLLSGFDFSAFHRLKADEIWHFYDGGSLTIYAINRQGILSQILLGKDLENGEVYQAVVHEGSWFAASVNNPGSYALVGCTLSPGFEFDDFEMGERASLIEQFPQHEQLIRRFTRR